MPDSPFSTTYGSNGASVTSLGEPGIGPWSILQFPTSLPECHYSQETEGRPSACPHRQACYQALGKRYQRRGQYQRPDVTVYDRLDIARRFHAPDRRWGEVTDMAREYDLSRPTIYDLAERVSVLFEPRLPGPVPCLKQLLPCAEAQDSVPCGALLPRPVAETKVLSRQEAEHQRTLS